MIKVKPISIPKAAFESSPAFINFLDHLRRPDVKKGQFRKNQSPKVKK